MFRKRHPQAGARPGTLLIGPDEDATRINVVTYSEKWVRQSANCSVAELDQAIGDDHVTWIDVQGFANQEQLQEIAELFHIHPLAMEDIVNVPQRPKTEPYADHLLIIARSISAHGIDGWQQQQISMIVGKNYVITFQGHHSQQFAAVRQRIDYPTARLRHGKADYLAYAILDTVVDEYFPILEWVGEHLEQLERSVIDHPHPALLQQINAIKNRLLNLRRTMWPQRDAVQTLLNDGNGLISDHVGTFLRDTYDHCVQTADVVEMYRELATGLLNTYMSSVAHRSNEIMKVLTIVSTIFVPLTFVAGIYGMNFQNMPELDFAWSYSIVWGLMLSIAGGMVLMFHRMGWIRISALESRADDDASSTDSSDECDPPITLRVLEHDRRRLTDDPNVPIRRAS